MIICAHDDICVLHRKTINIGIGKIKLTIDACGYTWEGLWKQDREGEQSNNGHKYDNNAINNCSSNKENNIYF